MTFFSAYTTALLFLALLMCVKGLSLALLSGAVLVPPVLNRKMFMLTGGVSLAVFAYATSVSLTYALIAFIASLIVVSAASLPPLVLPKSFPGLDLRELAKAIGVFSVGIVLFCGSFGPYAFAFFLIPAVLFGCILMLLYVAVAGGKLRDYLITLCLILFINICCLGLILGALSLIEI